MSRMDVLIGQAYQLVAYRDLSVPCQLAIAQFLAIDGDAWEPFFDVRKLEEGNTGPALMASLPEYVRVYGDTLVGVIDLPAQRIKQAVMADPDLATSYSSWEDYTASYCAGGDVPHYGVENRWPVILSSDDYETLLDGWHRLHSYMRAGFASIPAIFFPGERHISALPGRS